MPARITRSRVFVTGTAILALAVMSGCSFTKEPTTSAPSVSATPSEIAPPGKVTKPANAAPASAALTKDGTILKFGEVANVQVGYEPNQWIGGVKVTKLEKAPTSDYKGLGIRDDAGSVYYLRYDLTYLAGKTKYPPTGDRIGSSLHPLLTEVQKTTRPDNFDFKKCTSTIKNADGHTDYDAQDLAIGDTATNMCSVFLLKRGEVSQVVHVSDGANNEVLNIVWE